MKYQVLFAIIEIVQKFVVLRRIDNSILTGGEIMAKKSVRKDSFIRRIAKIQQRSQTKKSKSGGKKK
jgi:hypothetical protein